MQAGRIGLAAQAFAVASSNDSGGKKSRIRRSKEERKSMAESFIKRYQESNNGNFPSLNLAHKEVGGSFYTVREIVREIIQENRVLAPPKEFVEEHGLSGFMEQHPLGSISVEPIHFRGAEHISTSNGSYPLEVNNEQTVGGGCELVDKDEGSERMSENHPVPNHYQDSPQSKSHMFEEDIVNEFVVVDGSPHTGKQPLVRSVDHHNEIDEEQGSSDEQYHAKNGQNVDKEKEFGQRISTRIETLDQEKLKAEHIETSPSVKFHTNSDVVVETFPLRPVTRTIDNMSQESDELQEAAKIVEDKVIEQKEKTNMQISSGSVSEKGDKKLPHSTLELNGEISDAKVVLNLQGPSMENAKYPSASKPSVVDAGETGQLESKDSLPGGAKVSSSTKTLISEESTAVEGKSIDRDNPTLDRINLETWDRSTKKYPQPESNPLVALVKTIISSFVKFFTEE